MGASDVDILRAKKVVKSAGTVAALGTNQATAAPLRKSFNEVTGSDSVKGVRLPAATPGEEVVVINTVLAQTLPVYPATGATIDYGAANAAFVVAARKHVRFHAITKLKWYAVVGA